MIAKDKTFYYMIDRFLLINRLDELEHAVDGNEAF